MDINKEMLKWSQTVYGIAHALHIAHSINFGNLDTLLSSLRSAEAWNISNLGFESSLPRKAFTDGSVGLSGTNHEVIFSRVVENITKILFVNLSVIADESLGYLISKTGHAPGNYLINKVEWAKSRIDPRFLWAINGMFEIVAIRNAIVHNNGRWNESSIAILAKAGIVDIDRSIKIALSFGDLFRYRRALRTVAGELRKLIRSTAS